MVVLCFRLFRFGFGLIVVAVAVVVAEVFVNFVFCFCYSRKEIVSKTNWIFGFDFFDSIVSKFGGRFKEVLIYHEVTPLRQRM